MELLVRTTWKRMETFGAKLPAHADSFNDFAGALRRVRRRQQASGLLSLRNGWQMAIATAVPMFPFPLRDSV